MVEEIQREPHISPEDEIRELERKIAEKKREAAEKLVLDRDRGKETKPEEKEMLREVLKERIEALKQPPVSPQPLIPTPLPPAGKPADGIVHPREEDTRALIEIALVKGIAEAVKIAERDSPYLLDELHDHLADDFYEKLVQLRKLKRL